MPKTHKSKLDRGLKHTKVNSTENSNTFKTRKPKFVRGLKHA